MTDAPRLRTVREAEDAAQVEETAQYLEDCAGIVRLKRMKCALMILVDDDNGLLTKWAGLLATDSFKQVGLLEAPKHDILRSRHE